VWPGMLLAPASLQLCGQVYCKADISLGWSPGTMLGQQLRGMAGILVADGYNFSSLLVINLFLSTPCAYVCLHTPHSTEAVTVGEWFHLNVAKVMVAMATDKLSFFSVCSDVCYNT